MAGRAPIRRPLDRPPAERAAAWLYTGPLGRLYGTLADIAELWAKWMLQRARARAARRRA